MRFPVFFFKKEKVFVATPGFFEPSALLGSVAFFSSPSGLGLRLNTAAVFWKAAEEKDFTFPKKTTMGLGPLGFFSFSSFEEDLAEDLSDLSLLFAEVELPPSLLSDWSILALIKSHDSRSSAAWDFAFLSGVGILSLLRESFWEFSTSTNSALSISSW
ncbi:MAG: hypothetical protein K6C40_13120 [Thermoguttaceae bacterium]|nr:hypothetical protein [Thermoguttaceae bacterium]